MGPDGSEGTLEHVDDISDDLDLEVPVVGAPVDRTSEPSRPGMTSLAGVMTSLATLGVVGGLLLSHWKLTTWRMNKNKSSLIYVAFVIYLILWVRHSVHVEC